ncbi:MAG: c-type cytochrome [Polaromonas sp.]
MLVFLIAPVAPVHAAGDAVAGRAAFNKCASCHQVGPNAKSGFGPHLSAIIGRPAAAAKDYNYSDAMKKSGLVWDEKTLTAFIKAPSDTVPGTKMRFWGISNDKQIADMLAYLRSVQ